MRLYDYVASGNCYKARLLLAQLERSYERVAVDIFAGDTLAEDFAAKNPVRTTPVLETDDGRYLQESNAILWYLAEGTAFLPSSRIDRAHVLKWLILEQTDVMFGIGRARAGGQIERPGPLHVDTSTRTDIVDFAGKPESERRGRYDGYRRFDALGYDCAGKPATGRD